MKTRGEHCAKEHKAGLSFIGKIDLVYDGADSITLNRFNEVLYKLRYHSIDVYFNHLNRSQF